MKRLDQFHQLMDEVQRPCTMGGLVTRGITSVTVALLANDLAMADQISTQDDEIDLLSVEAEEVHRFGPTTSCC